MRVLNHGPARAAKSKITSIGVAGAIAAADAEAAKPTIVDAHEPGGVRGL